MKIAASKPQNKMQAAALKSRDLAEVLNGTLRDSDLNSKIMTSGQKMLVSYRSCRSEAGNALPTATDKDTGATSESAYNCISNQKSR